MSYPGLYRAKVASVAANGVFDVLIPQVFGPVPVPIADCVGPLPESTDMGYVGFISGEAAWPVWMGDSAGLLALQSLSVQEASEAVAAINDNLSALEDDVSSLESDVGDLDTDVSDLFDLSDGKVDVSGDTMTGHLVLSGAPSSDLHASTKKYVDDAVSSASSDLSDEIDDVDNPPGVSVWRNSSQSIPDSTATPVIWTNEEWDVGGFWTTGTDCTVPVGAAGRYQMNGWCQFSTNATGTRVIYLSKNDGLPQLTWSAELPGDQGNRVSISGSLYLDEDDYISVHVLQTSGGSLSLSRAMLTLHRIGQ